MIGNRIGSKIGPRVGSAVGVGTDELGGGFIGQGNPNRAVLIWHQSNALGLGIATNIDAETPGISSPNANVGLRRKGATAAGGSANSYTLEGPIDLQPRVSGFGSFAAGTCGIELTLGKDLHAGSAGGWKIYQIGIDGSGLEDEWNNPSYPASPPSAFAGMITSLTSWLVADNAHLELVVPVGGESDSNESPDFSRFRTNLDAIHASLRNTFGPFKIVVPLLSWHSAAGGSIQEIIAQQQAHVRGLTLADWANTAALSFRDGVHYADLNGYGILGSTVSTKYFEVLAAVPPANPFVHSVGTATIAGSGSALGPIFWPAVHAANDIGVIVISGLGVNPYLAPSGWTEVTNSPQHQGADNLAARLHVFWRRATSSAEPTPTIADVASDDAKIGVMFTVRGCKTSGNPFIATAGDSTDTAGASTSVTIPAVDTTGTNNCLVVDVLAHRVDSAVAQVSGWTNGNLTKLVEEFDQTTNTSLGYGIGIASGIKATGGSTGTTAATLATSASQARLKVAFSP